jgi:hypothetical protein
MPLLKNLLKDISSHMNVCSQATNDYKMFLVMLDKYEDVNLRNYVENNEEKLVIGGEQDGVKLKEEVSKFSENLKNPFFNVYIWIKDEMFDIDAVMSAIQYKDKIQQIILTKEKKKKSTQEDLDNFTTGRKTVKTLFKKSDDTGKMVNQIESVSRLLF